MWYLNPNKTNVVFVYEWFVYARFLFPSDTRLYEKLKSLEIDIRTVFATIKREIKMLIEFTKNELEIYIKHAEPTEFLETIQKLIPVSKSRYSGPLRCWSVRYPGPNLSPLNTLLYFLRGDPHMTSQISILDLSFLSPMTVQLEKPLPFDQASCLICLDDLEKTENVLSQFHFKPSRWYRAPFGRINKNMQKVLDKKKLQHIVCDCFANDTTIPDAKWISNFILKRVRPGSIVLIHMPEKNVREWNYNVLKLTLSGLQDKGMKIVNLSEMKTLCA